MQKLVVVCGPTAVGKTNLALKLARSTNGSIISVDSRQMYIGLDIGAGKDIPPGFSVKRSKSGIAVYSDGAVDVYGYDVFYPTSLQSPSQLEKKLSHVLNQFNRNKVLPILVSGSGNYLQALLTPPQTAIIPPNPKLRNDLESKNINELHEILMQADMNKLHSMNQSDRNNPRRLVRAIEVAKKIKLKSNGSTIKKIDLLWIGLTTSKELIEQRIKQRVEDRLAKGVIAETQRLLQTHPGCESLLRVTLGYQQILRFLSGEMSRNELVTDWSLKEFQYAKRQLTWFKKNTHINWFDITEPTIDTAVMNLVQSWKDYAKK